MSNFIKQAPYLLFSKECMNEYFYKYNFLHGECFKATLSKCLGYGVIAGSILVKVPQILKILQNKSADGINVLSVLLELFAVTAMSSYSYASGFPFNAWGDSVFLGIQTVIIACLVISYIKGVTKASAFLAVYMAFIATVIAGVIPIKVLWTAQAINIPVILVGKMIQAHTNYSNGSTGQISAVTTFMQLFGSIARIFTSFQETGDMTLISVYICSASTNGLIASQILYYWNAKVEESNKQKKKQ